MTLISISDTSGQDILLPTFKQHRSYMLWGVASAALVLLMLFTGRYYWQTADVDQVIEQQRLRLATVQRGEFIRDVMTQGRVVTGNSPTLFSPEPGYVRLQVKAGERVRAQQILAEVVSPALNERLAQEVSVLQRLQSEVERKKLDIKRRTFALQKAENLAQVDYSALEREKQRSDKLIARQLISQMNYERMVDNRDRAKLELQLARDNYAIEKESLAYELSMVQQQAAAQQLAVESLQRRVTELQVRSPADGLIGKITVRDSQAVNSFQPLLTVIDLSRFEIEAPVPEDTADDLLPGMGVEIKLNNQTYPGELLAVSPEVSQSQVITRIAFTDPIPDNLRQNQRLSLRILIQHQPNTVMVERGAFVDKFEGSVFVIDNNIATRRNVVLGERSYGFVEILDGLEPGETIISSDIAIDRSSQRLLIRN